MENPNQKARVVHSQTKSAWNVIGMGNGKHKIARCPYVAPNDDKVSEIYRKEAFNHAEFIAYCFNNSEKIIKDENN